MTPARFDKGAGILCFKSLSLDLAIGSKVRGQMFVTESVYTCSFVAG